jgi:hypothetical protein
MSTRADRFRRMVSSPALLLSIVTLLTTACNRPIDASKLPGFWQVDLPRRRALVFAYDTNQVFRILTVRSGVIEEGAMVGTWKLEGAVLKMSIRDATNQFGGLPPGSFPPNQTATRITKLDESTMVWRSSPFGAGLKLRRVPGTAR